MKKTSLVLFSVLVTTLASFAQSYTPPDSAAILRNHVKETRIYYTGTGMVNNLQETYRYNESGQCIFKMEGTPSTVNYYYLYKYDSFGRMNRSEQRQMSGEWISANDYEYFSDGKLSRSSLYYGYDTIYPTRVSDYDEHGNILKDIYLSRGKYYSGTIRTYNAKNEVVIKVDSLSNPQMTMVRENNILTRLSEYDSVQHTSDNWYLFYDSTGVLSSTLHQLPKISDLATVKYSSDGTYILFINGIPANPDQNYEWRLRWDAFTPHLHDPLEDELRDGLPYSDPPPQESVTHQLTRDKRGNITKDIVISSFDQNGKPVFFTYEYEYWK